MFSRLPIIALCSALLFGCGQGADTPKTQDTAPTPSSEKTAKTVAISAIVEHPSLDDIRRGVIAGLGDLGYKEGQNLTINFQSAQSSAVRSRSNCCYSVIFSNYRNGSWFCKLRNYEAFSGSGRDHGRQHWYHSDFLDLKPFRY